MRNFTITFKSYPLLLPVQVSRDHLVYFQTTAREAAALLDAAKDDRLQLHRVMQDVLGNALYTT